jgi:phosphoribosylformylglycinamidine synthase
MAQLSQAIDGIAEACTALGTPITGGNVSLYNETLGEGIYPTPVIGVVGILDDVTKSVPSGFQKVGTTAVIIQAGGKGEARDWSRGFGSSAYAREMTGSFWGFPPPIDINAEATLHRCLKKLAEQGLLYSASDISDGGLAVALAKACLGASFGGSFSFGEAEYHQIAPMLFCEYSSTVLVSTDQPEQVIAIAQKEFDCTADELGLITAGRFDISSDNAGTFISASIDELSLCHIRSLESALAEEVLA